MTLSDVRGDPNFSCVYIKSGILSKLIFCVQVEFLLFSLFSSISTVGDEPQIPIADYLQDRQFFLRMRSVMPRRGTGGKGKVIGFRVSINLPRSSAKERQKLCLIY